MLKREDIKHIYEIVQSLFLADDIPWVIGYSGGKDSTATLQLVWYALAELPDWQRTRKTVHVISTDTLVESHTEYISPPQSIWYHRLSLDILDAASY